MAVPVDIYVKDESPMPVVMPNVEVGIFSPTTHSLVASATTDINGLAAFSLPGTATPGTPYEVRAFKLGVNFHGLWNILVTDPALVGAPNKFDITGADSNILPISYSPYLCRCTGVMVNFQGQPIGNKTLRFMAKGENLCKVPKVTNGMMVTPDELEVRTDVNGRISIDLIRTGKYYVTWGGDDDTVWCITVPDEFAVNLIELIHPFPVLWDWNDTDAPGDAVALVVGQTAVIRLDLSFTDFSHLTTGTEPWFDLIVSDSTKVNFSLSNGAVSITGLVAGVTTITPTLRTDILPNRWPVPPVVAPPLTITVS